MILVNRDDVRTVIDTVVCVGEIGKDVEPYITLDRCDIERLSSEASEVVALVRRSGESLEQLAQGIQQEIAFIKRLTPERVATYAVSFSVSRELLRAEISIASDIIRQEVGDSPVKMGLSFVDGNTQRIIVIIGRK